jgi:hypothetical protein
MPWAIHLFDEKTTEVCCSYGKHRGTALLCYKYSAFFSYCQTKIKKAPEKGLENK